MTEKEYKPLTEESEWNFDMIHEYYGHIERIAKEKFKIDPYPNQIEIISSEQMLDSYCSVGMPISYNHWSFGKHFVSQQEAYNRGRMGLAYEIVINSDPCIAYLMEENTMMMQILVMAHACFGHNAFFKNNYLFKQWTDAEGIIDYLVFAKKYISKCEEMYGAEEVEEVLDACHALQTYGVDRYKRPSPLSAAQEEKQQEERNEYLQTQVNDLWRTIPKSEKKKLADDEKNFPEHPQENILYFIEKNAPNLDPWKREVIRVVRKMAQYFYPQRQTQLMNEGYATFTHFNIVQELHREGLINNGYMLEFLTSHTNVVRQPDFDSKQYSGINPYALGFAMFNDIKRICDDPTEEDRAWFEKQDWVGKGNSVDTVNWAMENFKDESFIMQFLSPKIIRDFRLFSVYDDEKDPKLEISSIHEDTGYKYVRQALSKQYNLGFNIPDIQVFNVDRWGDRSLTLRHYMLNQRPLDEDSTTEVLKHIHTLWGFDIKLESVDEKTKVRAAFEVSEDETLLDVFIDDNDDDDDDMGHF